MKIDNDILAILDRCTVEGNRLILPPGQLDRKTYVALDKVLGILGGKWDRRAKAHVFDADPTDLLSATISHGEIVDLKKELQFFSTPMSLVLDMIEWAGVARGHRVLEPSAGRGAIADPLRDLAGVMPVCVELDPAMARHLKDCGHTVTCADFLTLPPDPFDRVVMNPPFSRQQDIDHILHAFDFLVPGGVLVSVVSESAFFRTTRRSETFRALLEDHGADIRRNPEGAFRASGTGVSTRLVRIEKG